ncbi:KpsF/GutQ family sugar-phosphate isomerase [Ancylobacter sp. Lp-2]|uniref:KpsF/GutQ family sugar-phosphate isomerase n=1 Tax=Ancylobacter sp. Lp-2 TaxID=2881339 RepID=UPI001E547263|nr:KpsF/GutQ family sugar-phosphate isomerase [Ancylobacter sp. Lp-2]MCB4769473.1 KpsF/GutQ family sugar-phosphate isomerase [Ancylobacter sp. Lp-2]
MLNRTLPAERTDSPGVASLRRTLQKASEAVEALTDLARGDESLRAAFDAAVELVAGRKGRLIISGVGKSGHIGRKIAATMASTGTPAFFVHPTEASHGDLGMIAADDTLLLLSWSGETAELANVLAYAKRFDIPLIALTSREDSALGRNANVMLCLPQVAEACPHGLAPTTSTLLQLLVGDALAIALLEHRGFTPQDFGVFHPGGKLGSQLRPVGEIAHIGEEMPIIPTGTRMSEALLVMSSKGFGVIGIVDASGALVGVITDGDLRRHMAPDLLQQSVETVMSKRPRVVDEAMLAARVLLLMQSEKITVAFVVDSRRRPQGIIHIHDLLRAGVA